MTTPELLNINSRIFNIAEDVGAISLVEELRSVSEESFWHSVRTGVLAREVAGFIGEDEKTADITGFAGLVHDMGKTDPEIAGLIAQNRRLTAAERDRVGMHVPIGRRLISNLLAIGNGMNNSGIILPAISAAHSHHEDLTALTQVEKGVVRTAVCVQVADRVDARYDPSRERFTKRRIKPQDDVVHGAVLTEMLLNPIERGTIEEDGQHFIDVPRFNGLSYRNVLAYAHSAWANVFNATAHLQQEARAA